VGRETEQGMPSTSQLVNPLENYKRQRRAFRSGRLSGEPLHWFVFGSGGSNHSSVIYKESCLCGSLI